MASSTSFRISETAKRKLAGRADLEGVSATALLERLILEGVDRLDHPGIVFRGPAHDRRAALAAGPDVWEVVARLRELDGPEEDRIAVEYAVEHVEDIRGGIERNRELAERSRRAAEQRAALIA
ncbi:hypothetical protein [Qaidamihabitans albus]|uniref:hypothetical protein n=1 Tax=Qaidamihabitans albus TaxID=2795733 RepID=UPI0018F133E2|nr:hypothetical protein [Qaidamihabitans albus]